MVLSCYRNVKVKLFKKK